MIIICNPHNPVGRAWTVEELTRLGRIAVQNNLLVISDDIHCDILFEKKYIPFASLSEEFKKISFTCTSISKSFNLAGLQVAPLHY
jgi:cystathionine beta-lyase